VLAHDGVLLLADLARHEREAAREQLADQWLGFEEEELSGWLKAAGYYEVMCERIEGTTGQESVVLVIGKNNDTAQLLSSCSPKPNPEQIT